MGVETTSARPPSTRFRVVSALEVVVFVGSILAFMWAVQPATGQLVHVAFYLLMVAFLWLSAWAHGESWRARGVRYDNLLTAAARVLPATGALALGVVAAGWGLHTRAKLGPALAIIPPYFAWALVQQYALQAFVQRRLWDAGVGSHAPLAAAALFAVTHLPNPALFVLTFFGGWLWAACYRRCPNLFALALSHAILAVVVVTALPASITGGLHVGPGYWRH